MKYYQCAVLCEPVCGAYSHCGTIMEATNAHDYRHTDSGEQWTGLKEA